MEGLKKYRIIDGGAKARTVRASFEFTSLVVLAAIRFLLLFALVGISLAQTPAQAISKSQGENVVGTVSLVLGQAYVISDGNRKIISKGHMIKAGDSIYTELNGHVHVRFVDDALVSVRPKSTLKIERYEFDPANPQKSTVKFNLSEGVARSISGEAAKSARNRFRLNTPVAAIGVRGTDFVVNADSLSTRASVNEGVIVMAPFSDLCSVDGLGPCAANAVELAGNSLQVLEISGSAVLPSVQADQPSGQITDFQDRFQLAGSSAAGDREESDSSSAAVVYMETRGSDRVSEANVGLEFVDGSSASQGAQALLDYTPKAPFAVSNASDAQLVWGRFGNPGASDFLAVERSLAAEGRKVTIAASNYLLYRTEPNGARVDPNIGVVGFDLKSAQAFYNYETGQVMMRVADGTLDVDFVNNRFFTTLQLDHAMTGLIDFSGNGRVADGGYLLGLDDSQSVVGAVATDAREAGYFFEASRLGGNVSGLTLWGGRR